MNMQAIFIRIYVWLLNFYPRAFRKDFADEMLQVFVDALTEAAKSGNRTQMQFVLRELFDLIPAIVQEHLEKSKMAWLNRRMNDLRVIELVLLLVAIMGPWWFDVINVPAQYVCSNPFVRLEGDFCGGPVPGSWMPLTATSGFVPMVMELLSGTMVFADRIRDIFISLLFLLPVLPFISSLLMILGRHHRRRKVFHIIVLGLAVCFSLFMGANLMSTARFSRVWWMLWGLWLYIGVTVSALALELLTFNSEKQTRLGMSRPS